MSSMSPRTHMANLRKKAKRPKGGSLGQVTNNRKSKKQTIKPRRNSR